MRIPRPLVRLIRFVDGKGRMRLARCGGRPFPRMAVSHAKASVITLILLRDVGRQRFDVEDIAGSRQPWRLRDLDLTGEG